MNCAVHPDQECTQACSACGTLLCDSCDVVYLGRHYCKPCIERLALPLPSRDSALRNADGTLRVGTRFSRLLDRLMSRWYSVPLLFMGLLLIAAGMLTTESVRTSPPSEFEYQFAFNSMQTNSRSFDAGFPLSRAALSIMIQAGAALLLAGIFLVARRFSLRWLIAGVFAVALLSSYPFARLDGNPNLLHSIRVSRAGEIPEAEFASISAALQPQAAMATLTPAMQEKLNVNLIERVDVAHEGTRVRCLLHFREDATREQRAALNAFYEEYAILLVCNRRETSFSYGPSRWDECKAEWEKRNPPK